MLSVSPFGFSHTWWAEITVLVITAFLLICAFIKYKFSYWKRRGIYYTTGKFPFGSLTDFVLTRKSISEAIEDVYIELKGRKYIGYYTFWSPSLLVRDPDILRNIFIKHFENFADRGMYYNDKDDPLSAHLFALNGIKWKSTREKLSPTFATGKIKLMFDVMQNCSFQLQNFVNESIDNNNDVINFKHLISKHGVNVIANTAVGIEGHSLHNESRLSEIAFKVTEPTVIQGFRFGLAMLSKNIAKLFRMRFTPKEVQDHYLALTKQIVDYRCKNNISRNDFMQNLMQIWDKSTDFEKRSDIDAKGGLSLRDLAAQTFLFFLAAYESTSSAICFSLYELAKNPEIQEKLIKEVDEAGSLEDMTYEKILGLTYLDMVLNEMWRKYPAAGILFRECLNDYELPDGKIIEKGTTVVASSLGMGRDPEFFPDPERFDPERFNKESPSQFVKPFTYLPFGEGPRNCIGKRYGVIQTKITLFSLISKFRFEISSETTDPLRLDPKVFVTQSEGGMFLKVIKRN